MAKPVFLSLCALLPVAAHAATHTVKDIFSSWPNASLYIFFGIGGVLLLAVFLMFGTELFRSRRESQKTAELSWSVFESLCKTHGLNDVEKQELRRIFHASGAETSDVMFKSIKAFEEGVSAEIERLRGKHDELLRVCDIISAIRSRLEYTRLQPGTCYYSSRELSAGQPINISPVKGTDNAKFRSKIRDISELSMAVVNPEEQEAVAAFSQGSEVAVSLIQTGDAVYSFRTLVITKSPDNTSLTLAHVVEMDRKQLREYLRLEVTIEAMFRVLASEADPALAKSGAKFTGTIKDISGGGVKLRTVEEFHLGDVLSVNFNFRGESFRGLKSKVVRIEKKNTAGESFLFNNISFLSIDAALREKLIRLIFEKQREEIQWQ